VPEGDTIFRVAVVLGEALAGKRVVRFASPLPALGGAALVGRTVTGVEARGKNLLVAFDGGERTLHTHLRMSGRWVVDAPGRRVASALVVIETEDRLAALVRRRGAGAPPIVRLLSRDALRRDRLLRSLGPDVLAPSFDATEAARRLRASVHPTIAEALLDQRDVAGIGNEYKSELLFSCGIDPRTPPGALSEARLLELLGLARDLMTKNVARSRSGPPLAGTRPVRFAIAGRMTRFLPGSTRWVYGRANRPCLRCGTLVRSLYQGLERRRTYFCPLCQK
jgi:endonuclease-8